MKKLLLGAFLIAGTTLAFAKDNATSTTNNLKIEKSVFSKSTTITANSLEEAVQVFGICHTNVVTSHQQLVTTVDMQGNEYNWVQTTYTITTYFHGC